MPIEFQCLRCSATLSAREKHAGQQGKCPQCRAPFTVPQPESAGAAARTKPAGQRPGPPASVILDDEGDESIRFSNWSSADDELDMTPMVDVTFLLLIFFMITAAFSLQKSLHLPPDRQQQSTRNRTIEDFQEDREFVVVRIDRDNQFWLTSPLTDGERRTGSRSELVSQLQQVLRGSGASRMLVLADDQARHEFVVEVLDAGSEAGMEDVRLASVQ